MFLKTLQYKSAKKALTKKLSQDITKQVSNKLIETVGIIVNADEIDDFQRIVKGLKLPVVVEVLCYHKDLKKTRTVDYPVFYEKDFGWKGKPQTKDLEQFLEKPFDLLISYYTNDSLPLQLVSGLQKAEFKIGITGCDQEVHDVIIQTKEDEIETFTKELHRYLHILNKLS
ncbi:DUF6913 domain-containing protein [Kordia sp.]|uniref:DUF6913 domain-containing protein n=1 Tax=Kordia sp. TaxID=1965332 RepID=UPI003B5AD4AD